MAIDQDPKPKLPTPLDHPLEIEIGACQVWRFVIVECPKAYGDSHSIETPFLHRSEVVLGVVRLPMVLELVLRAIGLVQRPLIRSIRAFEEIRSHPFLDDQVSAGICAVKICRASLHRWGGSGGTVRQGSGTRGAAGVAGLGRVRLGYFVRRIFNAGRDCVRLGYSIRGIFDAARDCLVIAVGAGHVARSSLAVWVSCVS